MWDSSWREVGSFAIVSPLLPRGGFCPTAKARRPDPMDRCDCSRIVALVLCLLACGLCGCRQGEPQTSSWWPWAITTDKVAGIVPPGERVQAICAMAEQAAKNGPAEQQRIATQLSEMYPREIDPVIRGAIVRALGSCPSPIAMGLLVQALKDKDADIRAVPAKRLENRVVRKPRPRSAESWLAMLTLMCGWPRSRASEKPRIGNRPRWLHWAPSWTIVIRRCSSKPSAPSAGFRHKIWATTCSSGEPT